MLFVCPCCLWHDFNIYLRGSVLSKIKIFMGGILANTNKQEEENKIPPHVCNNHS